MQITKAHGRMEVYTVMRRLKTGISAEKSDVGDFVIVRMSYSVLTQN